MLKIAIIITTYNLEEYVSQALDSVLMQETNFEYKIFIGDDCSQDNTLKILRDYESRFPNKICVIPSDVNLGSLANSNRLFDGLQCEYFTFLDGDDYWVGTDRLQKQVDYMDGHQDCFLCAGNTQYLVNNVPQNLMLNSRELNRKYTFQDMLEGNMPFFHTSSILIRNKIFVNGIPECYKNAVGTFEECALRGEDFRRILHLEKGYLYAMDSLMSVYRIHNKGIWQGTSDLRRRIERVIGENFYVKYFGTKYGTYFQKNFERSYTELMKYLLLRQGLLNNYGLCIRDSCLFTGLLNDIAAHNENYGTKYQPLDKIKIWLFKRLLKNI